MLCMLYKFVYYVCMASYCDILGRYFKQCMVMIRFLCFQYFFCVSSGQPKFKCHLSIYNTDPELAILFFFAARDRIRYQVYKKA